MGLPDAGTLSLARDGVAFVRDAGIIGILIMAAIGGWRRWWVWGWQYDECCAERTILRQHHDDLALQWSDAVSVSRRMQELHQGRDEGC